MTRMTPTRAFAAFLAERRAQGLSDAGEAWFRECWARFTTFAGWRRFPDRFTSLSYLRLLGQQGTSEEERWRLWRGLAQVLRYFEESGFTRHHLGKVDLRPPQASGRPALTEDRYLPLIGAARRHKAERLVVLLWFTGWRSSAVVKLTWNDADFDAGLLYGPMFDGQRAAMQLQGRLAERLRTWKAASTSPYILGAQLTVPDVHRIVRGIGKTARLPFLAPGQFQRAYVRQYLRHSLHPFGPDAAYLSHRLGHAIRPKDVPIPNVFTFEEIRAAHDLHSPANTLLRNDPPQPSRQPLKSLKSRRQK